MGDRQGQTNILSALQQDPRAQDLPIAFYITRAAAASRSQFYSGPESSPPPPYVSRKSPDKKNRPTPPAASRAAQPSLQPSTRDHDGAAKKATELTYKTRVGLSLSLSRSLSCLSPFPRIQRKEANQKLIRLFQNVEKPTPQKPGYPRCCCSFLFVTPLTPSHAVWSFFCETPETPYRRKKKKKRKKREKRRIRREE
ncbi:uncharacterized protein K452DRAFT_84462 [Aplosporella prunicola CBS 121167]|uniref:Uncharacterized protein n=1 Tax=Aplosporella prunicola CBS 121167 TaxID=1176127 RepID=A0A6A6B669_9PEZI|nr:uncharacterized protein K452DRAFT_84462 [Aplosporella prunicola CBS 121167]KAF2138775.1 hypothetical protein K452DRAFT_84462 [Aplosporella prunicola CBS 121167]